MEINRNNYGAFFLDYWESNLDDRGKERLALFLESNPDLQNEFLDFKYATDSRLNPGEVFTFPYKSKLKKVEVQTVGEINQHNWEQYVIASLEKDLSPLDSMLFEEFVSKNPQIFRDIELFRKTFLIPDQKIVFDQKESLKRRVIPVWWHNPAVRWGTSIAAMFLIAFSIYWNTTTHRSGKTEQPGFVSTSEFPLVAEKNNDQWLDNLQATILPPVASGNLVDGETTELKSKPVTTYSGDSESKTSQDRQEMPLLAMNRREVPESIPVKMVHHPLPDNRNDFSMIFDYMMIRDGLKLEIEPEKSNFGRMVAVTINRITGGKDKQMEEVLNPMLSSVTEKGKDLLAYATEALPVYQTKSDSGRKETYFALSDNFNIRLSRSKDVTP